MSMLTKVTINAHYTRSINLSRDADSSAIMRSYIPTSRVLKTLEKISYSLQQDEAPRAWSLVGPYGSGKSSFGVFLSHLLSNSNSTNKVAKDILGKSSKQQQATYEALVANSTGYCVVLLTGSPDSLSKSIVKSLSDSANSIWQTRRGKKPEVIEILSHYASQDEIPKVGEIIDAIRSLQDALKKIGYCGIIIAIDELGKFLEYEARHYGANDIFLLQELAELAFAKHDVKLALVVMLHQSIEQYAKGLGETLKNEWAKVQGRFESIPFVDTSEQTLRLVAAAIEKDFTTSEVKSVKAIIAKQVNVLFSNNALPNSLDKDSAQELFYNCYPLHPISALVLPILCQKVAQNERTLFSYLGSKETHGFLDSLSSNENLMQQIEPWEVYEYFIRNQPVATSDHFTHRRWAEVVTAVERLGDADFATIKILKTIGLLNIIGSHAGLKASPKLLEICSKNKAANNRSLDELVSSSIIQFRKFNSEYRVWQGSDFDIEVKAEEARNKLGNFPLAQKLNDRHEILPIVARKYSIESGALRYFDPVFISRDDYKVIEKKSRQPRVIFYLSESKDDKKFFLNDVLNHFDSNDIFVLCPNGEQIREVLAEVLALEQVASSSPELTSDPVAQREYTDRYESSLEQEAQLVSSIIDSPKLNEWYWHSKKLEFNNKRSLQQLFSKVLSDIYHSSPILKNELINRNRASGQANQARNKLIERLSQNLEEEDLGIDKFPAEKAIYRSFLQATAIHYEDNGVWKLAQAEQLKKSKDPLNFYPVWKRIEDFFKGTVKTPSPLTELNEELYSAPYGIKEGVLPLLYIVAILAYKEKLAITEENVYVPYLGQDHLERFIRRPDMFTIQYVELEGLNRNIIHQYSLVWEGGKQDSVIKIARTIGKFIDKLPFYTQQSKSHLSPQAKSLLGAFKISKSPVKLLFEALPEALGIDINNGASSDLSVELSKTLLELQSCYENMKKDMIGIITKSFDIPNNSELAVIKDSVASRCKGLENYTIDDSGKRGFIIRAQRSQLEDDAWLENLLMFLLSKPASKWTDTERVAAEYKLGSLISKIHDIETLRISYEKNQTKTGSSEVYLLQSTRVAGKEESSEKDVNNVDKVIVVDEKLKQIIDTVKDDIATILENKSLPDQARLAALAVVVDEYLKKDQNKADSKKQKSKKDDSDAVA